MNTSTFEKEFASLGGNSSQHEQKNHSFSYSNPNQNSASNLDNSAKGLSSVYGRGSLKNLSNDDLEKLIQLKSQNIDKLQTPAPYTGSNHDRQNAIAGSGIIHANSKVNQILNKYNLASANEGKSAEPDFLNNTGSVSAGLGYSLPTGFTNPSFEYQNKRPMPLSKPPADSRSLNTSENPYLSNLETSANQLEAQNKYVPKDIETIAYNHEHETNRENQPSFAYESSPLLVSQTERLHSKENRPTNRVLLTPKQSGQPKTQRNDGGSPAIAGAMKALQERMTKTEIENEELRRKVGSVATEKQRELEEQRRKMYKELEERQEKEAGLRKQIENLNDQNFGLEREISRLQATNKTIDEHVQTLRGEVNKLKEDNKALQQENSIMNKEIALVENEKTYHLEQNANDKDSYENKIDELTAELEQINEKYDRLKRQYEENENIRTHLEKELEHMSLESAKEDKQNKEKIRHLEQKLEESYRQNQAYFQEFSVTSERYEREKASLQKKVNDFDKRVEAVVLSYEEKHEAFREENKELKRSYHNQQTESVNLKKKVSQLEKENSKLEHDRDEKERVIRQLMEMNDDLIRKMKKDPNNTTLQNIILKKKKIEQDLQSKKQEQNTARKTNYSRRKNYTRSRSPSVHKSGKKGHLSVEDLNVTQDEHKHEASLSTSKTKKFATDQSTKPYSPYRAQNTVSPRRDLSGTNNLRSSRSLSKNEKQVDISKPEDLRSDYQSTKNAPVTTTTDVRRFLTGYSAKEYGLKSIEEGVRENNVAKINTRLDNMSSSEISAEIVKLEREVAELKREYKNLLSKAQNHTTENIQEVKARLGLVADELQEKSEIHLLTKKKQREILAKNL